MEPVVIVDGAALEQVSAAARRSERARMNRNLHAMDDPIHRLLNATEPGTYVRPHRHLDLPKRETLAVIAGRGGLVFFDDDGRVVRTIVVSPAGPARVVEIPAGHWHSLVALETGTVWFEIKPGPYQAPCAADVAAWAPAEGSPDAAAYLARLLGTCAA